jgi:Lrp/AsnC family leucine-responsive transcriptional regulator
MLDRFDRLLLNLLQRDAARTAESLARDVPLSPSAIARRLRRLRTDGTIARTGISLSPSIAENRLRAVVTVQLEDHGKLEAILELKRQLRETPAVQFFYETAGSLDFVLVFDCANMGEFNALVFAMIMGNPIVHRHECLFILHELKGDPFIDMTAADIR